MPAEGEPYAAIGPDVAALGLDGTVQAFDARTGAPRWTTPVAGPAASGAVNARAPSPAIGGNAPTDAEHATSAGRAIGATLGARQAAAGEQIVSVRSWPGVVTVGLSAVPGGSGGAVPGGPVPGGSGSVHRAGAGMPAVNRPLPGRQAPGQQTEEVLDAATGREIRAYPGAPFGGTVAADSRHTVVVQSRAVTSYRNATGAVAWSVPTGPVPQAWKLDGDYLYMTAGAGGTLSGVAQQPATELRRIDVRTGAERIIRAHPGPFAGSLGAVLDGVVLFGNADGVTAYSGATGRELWSRHRQGLPQGVDLTDRRFYLSERGGLAAVDPWTGAGEAWLPGSTGLYAERGGVAIGIDQGPAGSAWGVDTGTERVVWTVASLPWPHYFTDLSGLGGSADPRSDAVIVAACGQAAPGNAAQPCAKPELVAINR